jgi:transcriptional regulator with XRE-family HTH domain
MKITTFGDRVAAARKKAGMTQLQLAEKTGYSKNTICRLEKSHSAADVTQVTRIGDALKCDLAWLLTGQEVPEKTLGGAIPVFRASKINKHNPPSSHPESFLTYPGLNSCDFAVINEGPAMAPRILEGSLVAIKSGKAEDGEVAALVDEWGVLQIRWKRRVDGKVIYVAENPQYQAIPGDKAKEIGRVIAGIQANFY